MMRENTIAKAWQQQAKSDLETSQLLLKHRKFAPSLFFLHLSLEKELKAMVTVVQRAAPPYTHDLVTLASRAELSLTKSQEDFLREVNTFNVRARYDDYKRNFYKRATAPYTRRAHKRALGFLLWLQQNGKR